MLGAFDDDLAALVGPRVDVPEGGLVVAREEVCGGNGDAGPRRRECLPVVGGSMCVWTRTSVE